MSLEKYCLQQYFLEHPLSCKPGQSGTAALQTRNVLVLMLTPIVLGYTALRSQLHNLVIGMDTIGGWIGMSYRKATVGKTR